VFAGPKTLWSVVGTIAGIVSPLLGIALWLLLFNSYRLEKKMLVKQVVKHLQASDICNIADASAAAAPTPNPIMTTANSISSSGQLLLDVPSSGIVPGLTMRRSAPADPLFYDPDDAVMPSEPAKDIQQVAKEITLRCLQRWDGVMGFRASSDSLGRQSGIWRDRFDGVRFASLLLAFRKLNAALAFNQPGDSGERCLPAGINSHLQMQLHLTCMTLRRGPLMHLHLHIQRHLLMLTLLSFACIFSSQQLLQQQTHRDAQTPCRWPLIVYACSINCVKMSCCVWSCRLSV